MEAYLLLLAVVLNFIFLASLIFCVRLGVLMCEYSENDDINLKNYHELEEIPSISGGLETVIIP